MTSFEPKVVHIYQSTGRSRKVNVVLKLFDRCGVSSTASRTLLVMDPTAVAQKNIDGVPTGFELAQSFPNPISLNGDQLPLMRIAFQLPKATEVRLSVYNIFGQHVRTLLSRRYGPGHYETEWDLRDDHGKPVSVGIYFYSLYAVGYSSTKKLVITR